MLKIDKLPPVTYRMADGFSFTASARIGRDILTQVRKQVRAARLQKTPLDEVQGILEDLHDKLDFGIRTYEQNARAVEELHMVIGVLGGQLVAEVAEPRDDGHIVDSPDSDPYESVPSEPAAAVVEMARSVMATIQAAKAIDGTLDFVSLDETLAFLAEVRAHLVAENEAIIQMLDDTDAQLRMLATIAVSRSDDTPPQERSARMALAMKEAKDTGRPYTECRDAIEASAGPTLPVSAITSRYELVPELEGQTRYLTPQQMKQAAMDWLKAQVAARKRATAKHKAALRSDLIKDFEHVWRKADA